MPTIEQKFATFVSLLTPEEQRAVAPLMQTFAGALGGPQQGGAPEGNAALPPPTDAPPAMPAPGGAPPAASAIPGGPPIPPPGPDPTMSIGRQMYG